MKCPTSGTSISHAELGQRVNARKFRSKVAVGLKVICHALLCIWLDKIIGMPGVLGTERIFCGYILSINRIIRPLNYVPRCFQIHLRQ
jgi:hypothetical protein